MKKHLLILLLMSSAGYCYAQDYVQVVAGGLQLNYELEKLSRIEFAQDGINVVASDETGDLYLFDDNLEKIVFHPTKETSVATITDKQMTLFVARDGSHVAIRGYEGGKTTVDIYALTGQRMLTLRDWNGNDIDVSGLTQGVYVIKVGNKSAKFRK